MKSICFRFFFALTVLLAMCTLRETLSFGQTSDKSGTLIVSVTWGDVDNTPATQVYVEAHGFLYREHLEKSFVLKSSSAGRYEASLPPGIYDVFVSDGSSTPRCRRVSIVEDSKYWTLKLEIDDVYLAKMKFAKP